MLEKLKQIWRILFPPKPKPQPKLPPRPQHSIDDLVKRGEELRELHLQQKTENKIKVCPSCRSSVTELKKCANCGKVGCENCMTFNPTERKYYCDQCW